MGFPRAKSLTVLPYTLLIFFALSVYGQGSKPLTKRVFRADPKVYRAIRSGSDWKNPCLIVDRNGVGIILGGTQQNRSIPVESVSEALQRLPDSAWPLGLVVAVQDAGIQLVGDSPFIQRNREQLLSLLGKLHIAVELWPSN
jgi:hypothetical protein